jgi:hypothetical protein
MQTFFSIQWIAFDKSHFASSESFYCPPDRGFHNLDPKHHSERRRLLSYTPRNKGKGNPYWGFFAQHVEFLTNHPLWKTFTGFPENQGFYIIQKCMFWWKNPDKPLILRDSVSENVSNKDIGTLLPPTNCAVFFMEEDSSPAKRKYNLHVMHNGIKLFRSNFCPLSISSSTIWKWQASDKMLPTNWWGGWIVLKISPWIWLMNV